MYESLEYKDGQWLVYGVDACRATASRILTATTNESGLGVFQGGDRGFWRGRESVFVTLEEPRDKDTLKANVEKVLEAFEDKAVKTWTAKAANGYTLEITLKKGIFTYRVNGVELGVTQLSRVLSGTFDHTYGGIFGVEATFQAYPARQYTFRMGSWYDPDSYPDPALALVGRADKVYNHFWGA